MVSLVVTAAGEAYHRHPNPPAGDPAAAEIREVATPAARTCSCATSTRAAPTTSARPATELNGWMSTVEVSDLPALRASIRGLRKDHAAVVAGLTLPYSDGPSEGANTKVNS